MDQESHLRAGADGEPIVLLLRLFVGLQTAVMMVISRIRQRVIQGFIVFSFIFLLLWISAFLYGSFYYSYMPKAAFSTPVHYFYRTDCDSPASFHCSYPVANISLMKNKDHVLTLGQAYRVSLQLEMPDSPTNQELGMFMIKTTCFSRRGGSVASSARSARQLLSASSSRFVSTALTHSNLLITQPGQSQIRAAYARCRAPLLHKSMLRYRSDLLRYLGTLLFLPAFVTGMTEQKQVLDVELFSDYTDDPYTPSVSAVIEILSNKVQIYSSQLYIHAHFTGIRYLLFNFPLISAFVGVSSNFIFLSLLFILSYVRLLFKVDWGPQQLRADGLLADADSIVSNSQQEEDKDPIAGTGRADGSPPDERHRSAPAEARSAL